MKVRRLSLIDVPIELSFRILNYLSPVEILLSFRNVCQRINDIVDVYYPYQIFTSMKLNESMLKSLVFQRIADALEFNTTITQLDLQMCRIGDEGVKYLSQALKRNQTLTSLDLSWNEIGHRGMKDLAEALKINRTLLTLILARNRFGREGVKYLSFALMINQTLETLDLRLTWIGYEGAKLLNDALKINRSITSLNLIDTGIENDKDEFRENPLINMQVCIIRRRDLL